MFSNRISNISSSKESFDRAASFYNNALNSCEFKDSIAFIQNIPKTNARSRKRNIWFNPSYSLNVRTTVAKIYLDLIDKCFPKGHKFHKLFNRNKLKVSFSCLPIIKKIITSHNKSILSNTPDYTNQLCNCRQSTLCPLNGKYLRTNLIYICSIKKHINKKRDIITLDLLRKLSKIDCTNIKILLFMRVRLTPLSFKIRMGV